MVGRTFGHYRIEEKLGEGGMGAVYRARDLRLERSVAVKFLGGRELADETARARFMREARTASALNHPNICTIHEIGEAEGQVYIAMECVEGRPLSALVSRGGLPLDELLRYAIEAAGAVAYAHGRGIIHRDLKCSNTMVTPEGRIKILDFGLAKRLPESEPNAATRSAASLTEKGAIVGTLDYMAPEILKGKPATQQSDVWALGVMFYEMATGRLPFKGQTGFELSSAILREPPAPLPPQVPPGLGAIIGRSLEKEPAARYQGAGELRAALEAIQPGATTAAAAAGQVRKPPRRKWLAPAAALATALASFVVLVALNVGGLRDRLRGRAASPRIESLAVLPLENLSGDPQQEFFADGMTEQLITELGQISALHVISRTSVMHFKGTRETVPQIARELHVDGVIEGSVLRSGDRVRITAQLIYGPTDTHLWAKSYERDLRDVLLLQDEVARTIADEIKIKLTPEEQTRLASARAVSPEVYELYLRGRYHWNKRTVEELKKGIEYFEQAIEKDPAYPLPYSGVADSYNLLALYGGLPPTEAFPKAKANATKALEIDDRLAEAHASLAWIDFEFDWNWLAAEREFRRAIELNPSYPTAHRWYANGLTQQGRLDAALAEIGRAQQLDPLSVVTNATAGYTLYEARQYDRAIEEERKTLELDSNFPLARWTLGVACEQKGLSAEAITQFENAVTLEKNPMYIAALGHAYAVAGRRGAARKVLGDLAEISARRYVDSYHIAIVYTGLGEKDRAFASLERAYSERSSQLMDLKADPRLDPLRSDPRFADLLRRMGLPP